MVTIVPAIIPQSHAHLAESVKRVASFASCVQVDICDGKYTPDASWPYRGNAQDEYARIISSEAGLPEWELVDYEIDLMTYAPEEKVEEWITAGASRIIVHIESTHHFDSIFDLAQERGAEAALALKPSTDIELLAPHIERVSLVQVMGSDEIGRQGVHLDARVVGKIRDLRKRFGEVTIGVDIGVNRHTILSLYEAGATHFAVGSAIFGAPDAQAVVEELRTITSA